MWQISDPSQRKSGVGNLCIKNLPRDVTPQALSDTFSPFGELLSTKVATHQGESKGYGFVHFAYPADAQEAMRAFAEGNVSFPSASPPPAPQPTVEPFIPREARVAQRASVWTNVFVKNLPSSVTDKELKELFDEFGTIKSCVVMKNGDGSSKHFGFVAFESHDSAVAAAQSIHQEVFQGKKLWCGPAQRKSERWYELEKQKKLTNSTILYLKNFGEHLTEEELRQCFSKKDFGTIKSVKIMRDNQGYSKGFGFITFVSPQGAEIALKVMNGCTLPGSQQSLYVAFSNKVIRERKMRALFTQASYPYHPMVKDRSCL
uniref:RRM domain-containing protein n=1 Tax=Arcella intermedia TaxID=1963864 RepID=A0A6B2L9G8_9EUKA